MCIRDRFLSCLFISSLLLGCANDVENGEQTKKQAESISDIQERVKSDFGAKGGTWYSAEYAAGIDFKNCPGTAEPFLKIHIDNNKEYTAISKIAYYCESLSQYWIVKEQGGLTGSHYLTYGPFDLD